MNNVQLKLKIKTIIDNSNDSRRQASGTALFQFKRRQEMAVRPLEFVAFGQAAGMLLEGGEAGVYLVSGRMNIIPCSGKSLNPTLRLAINRSYSLS